MPVPRDVKRMRRGWWMAPRCYWCQGSIGGEMAYHVHSKDLNGRIRDEFDVHRDCFYDLAQYAADTPYLTAWRTYDIVGDA
jgi:hypothetical protein